MRLVAATRILNEQDIVEAFVRHTAAFVDHHVLLDNGSIDGTLDILGKLRGEGLQVSLYGTGSLSFNEVESGTFLFRTAVTAHGADWVLMLDTDEFIDGRHIGASLRDYLAWVGTVDPGRHCIKVRLDEYRPLPDDEDNIVVPLRIRRCMAPSENYKVFLKADLLARDAVVLPGNHGVTIDGGQPCPAVIDARLRLAHFAVRSSYQWISKVVIGWARVLAAGPDAVAAGHNYHYRDPFERLRCDPAQVLHNRDLMAWNVDREKLTEDPIAYLGGTLRYTQQADHPMHAVQVLMAYLERLAAQHGALMQRLQPPGGGEPSH